MILWFLGSWSTWSTARVGAVSPCGCWILLLVCERQAVGPARGSPAPPARRSQGIPESPPCHGIPWLHVASAHPLARWGRNFI